MSGSNLIARALGLLGAALLLHATPASAESFQWLLNNGYMVGKMSQGKSGALGWVLTGKDGKQF